MWIQDEVTQKFLSDIRKRLDITRFETREMMALDRDAILKAVGVNAALDDIIDAMDAFIEHRGFPPTEEYEEDFNDEEYGEEDIH